MRSLIFVVLLLSCIGSKCVEPLPSFKGEVVTEEQNLGTMDQFVENSLLQNAVKQGKEQAGLYTEPCRWTIIQPISKREGAMRNSAHFKFTALLFKLEVSCRQSDGSGNKTFGKDIEVLASELTGERKINSLEEFYRQVSPKVKVLIDDTPYLKSLAGPPPTPNAVLASTPEPSPTPTPKGFIEINPSPSPVLGGKDPVKGF